ncbi:MAG: adenosylcobinamide amidohydrolase [Desulfatitalea sp.]|nr:adenosylcobinamide amidohydrolase [Desulfatitalea sp.]NNK01409.1 adenosylcobinamide amidohydrolase [Desulfatitalea sp.]
MLLNKPYDGLEIHREDKIVYARFIIAHQVLSTCRVAGGLRDNIDVLYNHQSCEPVGHMHQRTRRAINDPAGYRRMICDRFDLPAERCATLGTAANMHHACIETRTFGDLIVTALCTGGVEANAGRVGDPAAYMETAEGFEKVPPNAALPGPGTINTMIFINRPLIPGAMVRVVMTATEAKTAALQELAVNSRYSEGLATGTGTDQIAVAAARTGHKPLTSAGKHAKLGELIGRSVHRAVKAALALQNSLTPAGQCSGKNHLERFGLDREGMKTAICRYLNKAQAALLRNNFTGIERDPVTVAAVAALVHLQDKFTWGILPAACRGEVMGAFAAQIACAVCGDYARMTPFRRELSDVAGGVDGAQVAELACRAMALGFSVKW